MPGDKDLKPMLLDPTPRFTQTIATFVGQAMETPHELDPGEPVRQIVHDEPPVSPEHPVDLPQRCVGVENVFQGAGGEHGVEATVWEGKSNQILAIHRAPSDQFTERSRSPVQGDVVRNHTQSTALQQIGHLAVETSPVQQVASGTYVRRDLISLSAIPLDALEAIQVVNGVPLGRTESKGKLENSLGLFTG